MYGQTRQTVKQLYQMPNLHLFCENPKHIETTKEKKNGAKTRQN